MYRGELVCMCPDSGDCSLADENLEKELEDFVTFPDFSQTRYEISGDPSPPAAFLNSSRIVHLDCVFTGIWPFSCVCIVLAHLEW